MPTEGVILVDGQNVIGLSPPQRNFGVVFQGYALFPHMTALENVEFPLRMRRYPAEKRRRLAFEMLDKVGLASMAGRRPRELSGGQQQRVALARALVFQPNALLLDEPLGSLDKNMRERMQHEIKQLQRTLGVTVLFVTHDQDEAMTMSDRIGVMNEGRIVQIGTPKEVYNHPNTVFVAGFLGETNLVPGEIKELGAKRAAVKIDEFNTNYVTVSPGSLIQRDEPAVISIRPEKMLILGPSDQADFAIKGTVCDHTFVGRYSRTVVNALGINFCVVGGICPCWTASRQAKR
jgi:putative spermidine/putrescine transport system ATP-binding protein